MDVALMGVAYLSGGSSITSFQWMDSWVMIVCLLAQLVGFIHNLSHNRLPSMDGALMAVGSPPVVPQRSNKEQIRSSFSTFCPLLFFSKLFVIKSKGR